MASLALGLMGAGIGASIGGTFLGMSAMSIGWTVGSTLGGMLFAPDGPDTYGPRLGELKVQSSSRGAPIPKVYGTSRIAGNVIWSGGIKETSHVQETGGGKGGGGGGSHTSYTYDCSFAVGLCEGEITGIRRIWADSILIYDRGSTATDDELTVSNQVGVTIYAGTEDQVVSPTIEAAEGVGNTPAFRGLAYVLFDQLQLEKHGNRIPNITCEVVSSGNFEFTQTYTELASEIAGGAGGDISCDWSPSGTIIGQPGYGGGAVHRFIDTNTLAEISGAPNFTNATDCSFSPTTTDAAVVHSSSPYVTVVNTSDWSTVATFVTANNATGCHYSLDGTMLAMTHIGGCSISNTSSYTVIEVLSIGTTFGCRFSEDSSKLAVSGSFGIRVFETSSWTELIHLSVPTVNLLDWSPDGAYLAFTTSSSAMLYRVVRTSDWGTVSTPTIIKNVGGCPRFSHNGKYLAITHTSGNRLTILEVENSWVILAGTPFVYSGTAISCCWSPDDSKLFVQRAYGSSLILSLVERIAVDEVTVSSIIGHVAGEVGVQSIDTSQVSDSLKGYVRTSKMTARSCLSVLISAYQLSATESDYNLKFTPLDGLKDVEIVESDLAAHDSGDLPDKLKIVRLEDTELPRRVTVSYSDFDGDYQIGVQQAQRVKLNG